MRKWFLTISMLLLVAGCGSNKPKYTQAELDLMPQPQREGLPEPTGGFVLAVGTETITADELLIEPLIEHFRPAAQQTTLDEFKQQARPSVSKILESKVVNILLYQQAKKNAPEGIDDAVAKEADKRVREFIVSFGGDYAKAEQTLKQDGFDWESFREFQKKMILSQSYIAKELPEQKPITYSELIECYNQMKDEFFAQPATLQFRLIDIEAAKLDLSETNQNRQQQAKRLANELIGRLDAGEYFDKLAEGYSGVSFIDHSDGVQPENLRKPYDILARQAEKMQRGQIAGPVEAGGHIFIMKLEDKQAESVQLFEKVQKQVEAKINQERWEQRYEQVIAKLAEKATIGNKDKFIDFCLEKLYRLSTQ